jgi:hypothetical protein
MGTGGALATSLSASFLLPRAMLLCAGLMSGVPLASAQAPDPAVRPAPLPGCITQDRLSGKQREVEESLRGEIRRESQAIYPFALAGALPTSVKILAGTENKTAALNVAVPFGELASLTLTAAAPLSESESRTSIAQLSEFANKGKAGVQLNWGVQRRPTPERASEILSSLLGACECATPTSNTVDGSGVTERGCDLTSLAERNTQVQKDLEAYRRTALFLSLKAEVGRQKFEFVDETTFDDDYQTKYPASGGVLVGALLAPWNVYATVGFRLEYGYNAAQQAVCGTPTGSSQACPLKAVGDPKSKRREVLEAEVRKFLPTPAKYPVGLSVVFRRDWRQDETSLEVPVYLVKDKNGGLSAGISVGHVWSATPQAGGARFAVFVGQTFGLAPQSN